MPSLKPTGRGVKWLDVPEDQQVREGNAPKVVGPEPVVEKPGTLIKCHTCKQAMLLWRTETGDVPVAYCKLMQQRFFNVTACSEYIQDPKFAEEPEPSKESVV